jgi:hypothetical protein
MHLEILPPQRFQFVDERLLSKINKYEKNTIQTSYFSRIRYPS